MPTSRSSPQPSVLGADSPSHPSTSLSLCTSEILSVTIASRRSSSRRLVRGSSLTPSSSRGAMARAHWAWLTPMPATSTAPTAGNGTPAGIAPLAVAMTKWGIPISPSSIPSSTLRGRTSAKTISRTGAASYSRAPIPIMMNGWDSLEAMGRRPRSSPAKASPCSA